MKGNSIKNKKVKGRPKGTLKEKLNKENLVKLRERLLKEREESKLTLVELSNITNISKSYLGNFESGISIPNSDDLITLAKYYNVPTDYLLGLQDQKSMDVEIREVSKCIGLSEKSVNYLRRLSLNEKEKGLKDFCDNSKTISTIDYLLSNRYGRNVLERMRDYLFYLPIMKIYQKIESNYNTYNGDDCKITYKESDYISTEEISECKLNRMEQSIRSLKENTNEFESMLFEKKEYLEDEIKENSEKINKLNSNLPNNNDFYIEELEQLIYELEQEVNETDKKIKFFEENKKITHMLLEKGAKDNGKK